MLCPRGSLLSFGFRMNAEYRYTYTADLMIEGLQRYRQRHHQRLWMPWLRGVSFVGLVALIAVSMYGRALFPGLVFTLFLLLLLAGPRLDYYLMRRRHRKSPFFNSDVTVQLSDDGCVVADANSRSNLSWPLFTGGHRFQDGFLVLHGPQQFQWWPDNCLSVGSVSEIDTLLRSKVSIFTGAEQGAAGDVRNARA